MLWTEHRDRFEAGEYTVRRLTYWDFKELTDSISPDDLGRIGRLNAKRESGATLTQEETNTLVELADRWPTDALRGACFIPPVNGQRCREILAELPRSESEWLETILDDCIVPTTMTEADRDPLALLLISTGGLGIDTADMTVGQGLAIATILAGDKQ